MFIEALCLEALTSGVLSASDVKLIDREKANIVMVNEKPIIIADKYNLIMCNDDGRPVIKIKDNKLKEAILKIDNSK